MQLSFLARKGTKGWFAANRREILRHVRALDDFQAAHSAMSTLLSKWDTLRVTDIEAGALFQSAVVTYARPFSKTILPGGGSGVYSVKHLKTSNFDKDLHDHLIELRDKLLAHTDFDVFSPTIIVAHVKVIMGNGEIEEKAIGTSAISHSLQSTASRDRAEKLARHFNGCAHTVKEIVEKRLAEWLFEVRSHPSAHKDFLSTLSIPPQTFAIPTPVSPTETLQSKKLSQDAFVERVSRRPDAKVDQDDYIYRTTTVFFNPNDVTVTLPTGVVMPVTPFITARDSIDT